MHKSMNVIKTGITAGGLFLLLLLHACGPVVVDDQVLQPKNSERAQTYVFSCPEAYEFVARIENETAWLFLPTGTLNAQQTMPDVYQTANVTFRLEGQAAQLNEPGGQSLDCHNNRRRAVWEHAKLNGADFRAVGNEPGWSLEIRDQTKLFLVTNYGSERREFDLPEPAVNIVSRTTRYDVVQDGEKAALIISGDSCRDSMSGETFESTVEVVFNGETLRGCGRALH